MSKNFSLSEDLVDLLPTTPFKVRLDSKNEEKDVCVLEETLDFEHSNELIKDDQITLYSSHIKVYIEASEKNTNFNAIYTYMNNFFLCCALVRVL